MNKRHIRIHGDNIVECERTLTMIKEAIGGELRLVECPIYMPVYEILTSDALLKVELLSGHNRWGINIGDNLKRNGGILREGADSYICEVIEEKSIFFWQ